MRKRVFNRYSKSLKAFILLCLGTSLFLATPSSSHAQVIPQTTGVFAVNPVSSSGVVQSSILTDKYVKGIFVSFDWNNLETKENVYTWTAIDSVLKQAAARGKVVTMAVMAGYETPTWVYADGAQTFKFLWDRPTTSPAVCSVQSLPVPWDPVFTAKWQTFVGALGARYGGNPTLVSVTMYGINFRSVETSLPETNAELINYKGKSCTGYNYPVLWQRAGYTRTRIENALFGMQSYYQRAFPHTQLMAGLNPIGFPPIDQNGNLIPNQPADFQVPADLMASGAVALGPQFSGADGGLSATAAAWPLLTEYASTVNTGYQMAAPLGTSLPAAINTGIDAGVRWLQVYPGDITLSANQSAIISASETLR
jgi:hypothetical protein